MKRSLRRAVSLLCVLAMCIGLLPSTALAAGRPGGGGNYGGGGQETQQTVYVYIKIVDSNGQELTGSTVEIDGITYTVNEKGWYTIGTIQLDLPSPSDYNNGNYQTELTSNNASDIKNALGYISRYTANEGLISTEDLKDKAQFQSGVNSASVGLKAESGANDFNENDICWHLDMTVKIDDLKKYTVTYTDGVDSENVFADVTVSNVLGGTYTVGRGLTDEQKNSFKREGYTLTGWKIQSGDTTVYQMDDTYSLSRDTTFVAQWEKDPSQGNTINVEVYVDGNRAQASTYIGVKNWGDRTDNFSTATSTTYPYAEEVNFTYETYNCADFVISMESAAGTYVVQAIEAELIGGENGSAGIDKTEDGTYTLDNVAGGSTVKVYLYLPYEVRYYKDSDLLTENDYKDTNTYVASEKASSGDVPESEGTEATEITWVDGTYKTSIALAGLPAGTSGWYTSSEGTGSQYSDTIAVSEVKSGAKSDSSGKRYIPFYAVTKKADIAVTKTLTSVVRDGKSLAEVSDSTDLYEGDQLTWTITVTNSTNSELTFTIKDQLVIEKADDPNSPYEDFPHVKDGDKIIGYNPVVVQAGGSKTLTASWTVGGAEGYTLTNTATVTCNRKEYTGSATNKVNYAVKVNYDGNGGATTDGQQTKTVPVYGESKPISYTVESGAFGFTKEGYSFAGWYGDKAGTGKDRQGEKITLDRGITFYAQWEKDETQTKDLSYTVEYYKDGVLQQGDTQTVSKTVWVNDPNTLTVDKANINITDKYTGYMFDHSDPTPIPGTIKDGGVIKVYYVKADTPDYTVTIQPANITIYTGGDVYGGVTDANGNIIEDASGLPEPGYHLTLSTDVMTWLNEKTGTYGPRDLEDYLTFTYDVGGVTREWELTYVGVYDTNPTRYVYSLEPGVDENGEEIPVRLLFRDESGEVAYDDIIGMAENSVCEEYTMSINPGTLTQSEIKAVFTVPGEDPLTCGIAIQPGTLTIRSTTDEEYVNDIGANADGILADGNVTYYVNDSGVTVDEDRVGLLVDEVSNNAAFNREMAQDAMDHAIDSSATDWTHRSDLSYDMAYLNLVDTDNGHAVVTMGEGDSLTIYWPLPADADPYGDFHVVHYYTMDRESTVGEEGLSGTAKEILNGEAVRIDGQWYVRFTTDSFSPFVLVYEEEDNDRPSRPRPDPDDDKDDEDEEPEEDVTGLNTTDHYAYIAGYTDGTVRPDGNITRAEVATIFFRLMTDEYRETCWSTSSGFTDVTAANWYNNAISTTANAGWVSGYPDGTFRPDAYITRAEFATIAARFLSDVYGGTSMFTDITGHWAEDYINRAAAAGWINGYADGTFRPNAYITRAEAVTLINRMLDRAPDANHLLADMVRWPDNPETAWYYADIQEATNSHDYTRAGTGNYEVWTELLANRDWAALEEIWSQANDAPGGEVADGLTPNGN